MIGFVWWQSEPSFSFPWGSCNKLRRKDAKKHSTCKKEPQPAPALLLSRLLLTETTPWPQQGTLEMWAAQLKNTNTGRMGGPGKCASLLGSHPHNLWTAFPTKNVYFRTECSLLFFIIFLIPQKRRDDRALSRWRWESNDKWDIKKKKKRVDALGFSRDRNLRRLVFPGLIITYSFVLRKLNEKNTREGGIHSPNHLIWSPFCLMAKCPTR